MKILITGATGFLGRSLLEVLIKTSKEFECVCIYKRNPMHVDDARFKFIQCDLLDIVEIEKLMATFKPTQLVHLAWHVPPQTFWQALENLEWLNVSIHLFQTFCKNGGQLFVGAGSLAEYDWNSGVLDEQSTPLNPATLYGQCKKSLHEILLKLRDAYSPNIKIIWPRIGYFFGPYEPQEKLISKIISNIKNDFPIKLADPKFKRPYAHVNYFGQIMSEMLMRNNKEDSAFNMSATMGYSLQEIVASVQGAATADIEFGAYPSHPMVLSVSTDFLEKRGLQIPDTFLKDLQNFSAENQ